MISNRNVFFLVNEAGLLSRISCSLCLQVMIEPVQTECGCRFCLKCIESRLSKDDTECPNCHDRDNEGYHPIKDKAVEKEILNLDVRCTNGGCTTTMNLKELCDHLRLCDYRSEQCKDCQRWYPHITQGQHATNECNKRIIVCNDCGNEMSHDDYQTKHRNYGDNAANICHNWIAVCPYQCEKHTPVNVRLHLNHCPNIPTQCPLTQFGCHVTRRQQSMDKHMTDDVCNHQELIINVVKDLRTENVQLRLQIRENEEKFKDELRLLEAINNDNVTENMELRERLGQMERNIASLSGCGQRRDIVCVDGRVTWTIEDIRAKIESARRSRDNDHVMSEPVYLSHPGYYMALKVYLIGDGRARGQYLSVFFVIHRGLYDHQLSWPFTSKVILSLRSHSAAYSDIVARMKPDNNESCYGRPSSNHNVAAGQPQFVKLTEIMDSDTFVHNGALTFTLIIES